MQSFELVLKKSLTVLCGVSEDCVLKFWFLIVKRVAELGVSAGPGGFPPVCFPFIKESL